MSSSDLLCSQNNENLSGPNGYVDGKKLSKMVRSYAQHKAWGDNFFYKEEKSNCSQISSPYNIWQYQIFVSILEYLSKYFSIFNHLLPTKPANESIDKNVADKEIMEDIETDENVDSDDEERYEKTKGYYKGGYCPLILGSLLNERYYVIRKLGHGHFSTVWLCWDTDVKNKRLVAAKISKSGKSYSRAALDEIQLLEIVRNADKKDANRERCVQLLDGFIIDSLNGSHIVMILEIMGPNLLKILKKYDYKSVPIPITKKIVKQSLQGLSYLHDKCQLIHTDIKPENICIKLAPSHVKEMALESLNLQIKGGKIPDSHKCSLTRKYGDTLSELPQDLQLAMKINTKNSHILFSRNSNAWDPIEFKFLKKLKHTKQIVQKCSLSPQRIFDEINEHVKIEDKLGHSNVDEDIWENENLEIKIADMGNAVAIEEAEAFSIQTKPYRSPEVLLLAGFNQSADIWSLACVTFELITGDYLIKGRKSSSYGWERSHLMSMIERLGNIPKDVALSGKRSHKFFNSNGQFIDNEEINPEPIVEILTKKFKIPKREAKLIWEFLAPMVIYDYKMRCTAKQAINHIWLQNVN